MDKFLVENANKWMNEEDDNQYVNIIQNHPIFEIIKDIGLEDEWDRDPEGISFDLAEAIYVYIYDYNDNTKHINELNKLLKDLEFSPNLTLRNNPSRDYLKNDTNNGEHIYDALVNKYESNTQMEEEDGKTLVIKFNKADVDANTLDEIDAKLIRAGFVGDPDFTNITYTIKAEHLDRFIDIMSDEPFRYTYDGEIKEESDESFSLSKDLISGVTYEQLINTIEANEQSYDEETVELAFEEELNRVMDEAKENFELHKDKVIAALSNEGEQDEEEI